MKKPGIRHPVRALALAGALLATQAAVAQVSTGAFSGKFAATDKVSLRNVDTGFQRDVKVKGLSRGMRQRLGIARTMLPNPSLVFLDEPSAGLDPAGRVQFRQLLCSLRDQGKAIIVSSHILLDMAHA